MTAALARWWFAPMPARRLGLLRLLIGGYATVWALVRLPYLTGVGRYARERFDPIGPVGLVLDEPLAAGTVTALAVATLAAGLAFTAGWRFRFTGPLFAAGLLWVASYANSWGVVLHTENLMVLHVLVLGFTAAGTAVSVDARQRGGNPAAPHWRYGWPVRLLGLVVVIAYLLAGWAKVRNGGWDWVSGDVLRNHVAFDNLRKILLGSISSPVGGWLVGFGWLFPPMAFVSLVVELAAPVALFGTRPARLWAGLAWLFHVGVVALMAITFPYQLLGLAFAPLIEVDELWDRLRSKRRREVPAAGG